MPSSTGTRNLIAHHHSLVLDSILHGNDASAKVAPESWWDQIPSSWNVANHILPMFLDTLKAILLLSDSLQLLSNPDFNAPDLWFWHPQSILQHCTALQWPRTTILVLQFRHTLSYILVPNLAILSFGVIASTQLSWIWNLSLPLSSIQPSFQASTYTFQQLSTYHSRAL